jgi:hypothetical protein
MFRLPPLLSTSRGNAAVSSVAIGRYVWRVTFSCMFARRCEFQPSALSDKEIVTALRGLQTFNAILGFAIKVG